MCALLRKNFCSEKGQVLVFTVCMLPLLLGMMALVIELGNLYIHQSELQQVADASAVAGSKKWPSGVVEDSAVAVIKQKCKQATDKIITKNINTTPFTVTPSFHSDDDNFYVKLEEDVPPIFEKVFGDTPFKLTAYAGASKSQEKLIPLTSEVKDYPWDP